MGTNSWSEYSSSRDSDPAGVGHCLHGIALGASPCILHRVPSGHTLIIESKHDSALGRKQRRESSFMVEDQYERRKRPNIASSDLRMGVGISSKRKCSDQLRICNTFDGCDGRS